MVFAAAASQLPAASIAIVFAAAAGVVGAVIALFKLRPEANQSAVMQAQGAMETMVQLQDELEKALERANRRADHYRRERDELAERLAACEERFARAEALLGPFPP